MKVQAEERLDKLRNCPNGVFNPLGPLELSIKKMTMYVVAEMESCDSVNKKKYGEIVFSDNMK